VRQTTAINFALSEHSSLPHQRPIDPLSWFACNHAKRSEGAGLLQQERPRAFAQSSECLIIGIVLTRNTDGYAKSMRQIPYSYPSITFRAGLTISLASVAFCTSSAVRPGATSSSTNPPGDTLM